MHSVALRRIVLLAIPTAIAGFLFACSSDPTPPGDNTDDKGDSSTSTTAGSTSGSTSGSTAGSTSGSTAGSTAGQSTASGKFSEPCDAGTQCESQVCCLPGLGCGPGGGAGGGGGGGGGMQGNNNYWCSARCDAGPQCPNTGDGGAGVCSKNGYCQR